MWYRKRDLKTNFVIEHRLMLHDEVSRECWQAFNSGAAIRNKKCSNRVATRRKYAVKLHDENTVNPLICGISAMKKSVKIRFTFKRSLV